MGTISYAIDSMRVNPPSAKVAEANPDLAFTVAGTAFFNLDEKGKRSNEALSFTSKQVTKAQARDSATVVDIDGGILTLPEGRRGRTASTGIAQDDVNALLASLREATAE